MVHRTLLVAALAALVGIAPRAAATVPELPDSLSPATIAAWQDYERRVDERYNRLAGSGDAFFVLDEFKREPGWRQRALNGRVSLMQLTAPAPGADEPPVPNGRVHHWVGAVFVPGTTLDAVLRHLGENAGRESESYEEVIASKLLSREGDRIRVYMKLKREKIITVTYNTEHLVETRRLGSTRAISRSVATKIAELSDAGTPREREKPPGSDSGFLWRLNAYWRREQVPGGVLIECESVSLSRTIPWLLRPFLSGTVDGIARDSLEKTLVSLKAVLSRAAAEHPAQIEYR